jgi:ribosomal protein L16 Arg81 hydroxylase
MLAITELKEYWNKVNAKLSNHISQVSSDEWFTRHNNVSEADFAKEPHRNKLNIIINRTNHTSYHLGQLVYLAKNRD